MLLRTCFLSFSLCLCLSNLKGQDSIPAKKECPQKPMNIYKSNPFPVLWGSIPFTAEYRLIREVVVSPKESMVVGVSYMGKSPILSAMERSPGNNNGPNNPKIMIRGVRMQISYRYYPSNDDYAPHGMYFSPLVSYGTARFSTRFLNSRDVYIRATHFNINLLSGYQYIYDNWLVFDMFGGLGYRKNTWQAHRGTGSMRNVKQPDNILFTLPLKFTLGFNVGIAF